MNNIAIKAASFISILAFAAAPFSYAVAYQPTYAEDPQTMACRGLEMVGAGCATSGIAVGNYTPKPVHLNFDVFSSNSSNSETNELKVAVKNAKAPRDLNGEKINIVSVPGSPEIYMLVKGQKHAFPSLAVFYDYGYTPAMIQPITQDQLDKFPRAKMLKVKGDSKIYYLTENGLVREIVNPKKIYDIYGDRPEDVITISRKEFNLYPSNQYVYQITPLNRDVFQVSAKGKRYLTPMAVARLNLSYEQIAPVSQLELNTYKTLAPIVD